MSNTFNVAEEGHVISLEPVDVGGVAKTLYWSMADWKHASIIVTSGAANNLATLTVFKATSKAGAGEHAIAFTSYDAGATDVLGAATATPDTGVAQSAAQSRLVIEVDATDPDHPYLGVKTSAAAVNLISIVVVLSGGRYPGASSATVDPS